MTRSLAASLAAALLLGLGTGWALRPGPGTPAPADAPKERPASANAYLRKTSARPAGLSPAELALDAARLKRTARAGDPALLSTLCRLALLDPQRALDLAHLPSELGGRDEVALQAVFATLAQSDPASVAPWIARRPALEQRRLEAAWLGALGQEDVAAALAAVADRPWLEPALVGSWIGRVAERSTSEALALAQSLPTAAQRTAGLRAVLEQWTRADPRGALAWLAAQKGLREAEAHWKATLAVRAEQNPPAAADIAASGATGLEILPLLKPLLRAWSEKDLPAARAWIDSRPPEERNALLVELLPSWVKKDPARALAFAVSAPVDYESLALVREAMRAWKSADPTAAQQWLQTLPTGSLRERAVEAWVGQRVPASVDEAVASLELLRTLPGGPSRQERSAAERALRHLTRLDLEAAVRWVQSSPPGEQAAGLRAVLHDGASQSPERAAALLQSLPSNAGNAEERSRNRQLFGSVAQAWTERNPSAAAAWAVGLNDRAARESALYGVAAAWTERDAEAAWRWALGQGPQTQLDASAAILSTWAPQDAAAALAALRQLPADAHPRLLPRVLRYYAEIDPAAAAEMAVKLPGNAVRNSLLVEIVRVWEGRDMPAARRWIDQNRTSFTPAELSRLLPDR